MQFNRSEDIFGARIPIMDDVFEAEESGTRAPYNGSVTVALSAIPHADDPRTAFGQSCFMELQLLDLTLFKCRDIDR